MELLQIILKPIIGLLIFGIGYFIGFLPVTLLSLGAIEPGPMDKIEDFSYYRSQGLRWWHLTYRKDGQRYLPAEGVALVGWLVIASVVGIAWLLVQIAFSLNDFLCDYLLIPSLMSCIPLGVLAAIKLKFFRQRRKRDTWSSTPKLTLTFKNATIPYGVF